LISGTNVDLRVAVEFATDHSTKILEQCEPAIKEGIATLDTIIKDWTDLFEQDMEPWRTLI